MDLELPDAWRLPAEPEPATEDDLARYVLLREAVRGMQAEVERLEAKVAALAAVRGPGVLYRRPGATVLARRRRHLRWGPRADRDALLHRLGAWDAASAYSAARFAALYDADAALRAEVAPLLTEETRFDLRLNARP